MSAKIYVGNLPYSVTDSSLESNFAEFAGVSSTKVMMDRETGRSLLAPGTRSPPKTSPPSSRAMRM